MLQPMLKVPTRWTPLHSVAYLLHCVSLADGNIDPDEISETERMVRHYGNVDAAEAHGASLLAFEFLRQVVDEHGRMGYIASLREHAARLANFYGPGVLRSVISDMLRLARIDGTLDDSEVFVIQGVASDWSVEDDA